MAKEKKPPTLIKDLEKTQAVEKEKAEPGELSYVEKKNPMGNRGGERGINLSTVQALIPIIVSALVTIFIVFQMAPSKADLQPLEEGILGLTGSMDGLTSQVSSDSTTLGNVVATMGGYAKKSELDSLKGIPGQVDSKLATLSGEVDGKLADLEAILKELELEVVTADEMTRWDLEVYVTRYAKSLDVRWDVDPNKIREEEDYEIDVWIENSSTSVIDDGDLIIILKPKTGDRVQIEEAGFYFGSATHPYYDWDVEVMERSDGTCRRIRFSSGNVIDVPAGYTDADDDLVPGEAHLELEFALEYK